MLLHENTEAKFMFQAPHKICVHLPTLINHMFDAKTEKSLLVLFEACFQVKLTSPIVKFTGRITPTLYRTLYIFLQQFIVQVRNSNVGNKNVVKI